MKISIIIPVYNEDEDLNKLLKWLNQNSLEKNIHEVIVVDYANSSVIREEGVTVLQAPEKGRANQLSVGANYSSGEILYFLHADSIPPLQYDEMIISKMNDDHRAGCFQLSFDDKHPMFSFFAWFTKFNYNICRGGDQSLFVERDCYFDSGGFDTNLLLLEDIDIIRKIRKRTKFLILDRKLQTSTRKYKANGMYYLQWHFFVIHTMYSLGFSQHKLMAYYHQNIQ